MRDTWAFPIMWSRVGAPFPGLIPHSKPEMLQQKALFCLFGKVSWERRL